jgi:hypothetical protein
LGSDLNSGSLFHFPEESATRDPFERMSGREVAASSYKSRFKGIPRRRLLGKVIKGVGDRAKTLTIEQSSNQTIQSADWIV